MVHKKIMDISLRRFAVCDELNVKKDLEVVLTSFDESQKTCLDQDR